MDDSLFLFNFCTVSASMHEVKPGMAKEFSTTKKVFSLVGQMEKLGKKNYFRKPDRGSKIKNEG